MGSAFSSSSSSSSSSPLSPHKRRVSSLLLADEAAAEPSTNTNTTTTSSRGWPFLTPPRLRPRGPVTARERALGDPDLLADALAFLSPLELVIKAAAVSHGWRHVAFR
jgi:hypothetical protein